METRPSSRRDRHLLLDRRLLLLVLPHAVTLDQIHEGYDRLLVRDAFPNDLLAVIQIHLPGEGADVPEVGIGHLPRTVHDASHDGDCDPR